MLYLPSCLAHVYILYVLIGQSSNSEVVCMSEKEIWPYDEM